MRESRANEESNEQEAHIGQRQGSFEEAMCSSIFEFRQNESKINSARQVWGSQILEIADLTKCGKVLLFEDSCKRSKIHVIPNPVEP